MIILITLIITHHYHNYRLEQKNWNTALIFRMVCRIRASVCLTSLVTSLILPGPSLSPPDLTPVWLPTLSAGFCMFPSRHCGIQPFSVGGDEPILSLTPRHRWDENPSLNPPLFPSFQALISLFLPFHSLVQVYQLLPYSQPSFCLWNPPL